MSNLIEFLKVAEIIKARKDLKTTVLYRPNGKWHQDEIVRLVNGLMTEVAQHPGHPEYIILYGHFTKEETLKAMWGGIAYTATQIIGTEKLPFNPTFCR